MAVRECGIEGSSDKSRECGMEMEDKVIETTFDDLPDDILIKFFTFLDLPSRLKLRVNKRLDRLQFLLKNHFEGIGVKMRQHHYVVNVNYCNEVEYRDFNQLENALCRFALNTSVDSIYISMGSGASEEKRRVIKAVSKFDANKLTVNSTINFPLPKLSQVTLLNIAGNIRNANFSISWNSLSTQDLCILRKSILDGLRKLTSFRVHVQQEMAKFFLEECFGVTIFDEFEPRRTRMYRSTKESVELFTTADVFDPFSRLIHFEGGLQTIINQGNSIEFKRENTVFNREKILLNYLYVLL